MHFSSDGLHYFANFGHGVLLLLLAGQTSVLALKGKSLLVRFFGSLIAPASYTIVELREGIGFVLNMGHMFCGRSHRRAFLIKQYSPEPIVRRH